MEIGNYRLGKWFKNSHAETVWRAVEELHSKGITIPKLRAVAEKKQEGGKRKRDDGKPSMQAQAVKELTPEAVNILPTLRKDLRRWKVGVWDECKMWRASRVIRRLQDLVPPRVQAAVLRSWKMDGVRGEGTG